MVSGVKLREIQEAAKVGGLLKSSFEETEAEVLDITDEFYPDNGGNGGSVQGSEIPKAEIVEEIAVSEDDGNGKDGDNGNGKSKENNPAKTKTNKPVDIFEGTGVL